MMKPDEPYWNLYALISGINQKSRRLSEETLKRLKITFPQFGALLRLSFQDNVTQKELSDIMDTDTTTIMVICDSLEKKGLLKRMRDPSDRRVNRLILTEEGKNVISKAYPLMLKRYEFFVNSISKKELDEITPILDKLYKSIKSQYKKELGR
jgi:DNA-binding MarR family transcriptional regulator